jgi:hypothetical protein
MSATTTLKLPDDLKARIAVVAEQTGKTPHAFMVEALQRQTKLASNPPSRPSRRWPRTAWCTTPTRYSATCATVLPAAPPSNPSWSSYRP